MKVKAKWVFVFGIFGFLVPSFSPKILTYCLRKKSLGVVCRPLKSFNFSRKCSFPRWKSCTLRHRGYYRVISSTHCGQDAFVQENSNCNRQKIVANCWKYVTLCIAMQNQITFHQNLYNKKWQHGLLESRHIRFHQCVRTSNVVELSWLNMHLHKHVHQESASRTIANRGERLWN